jgi:hypothetical protein
MILLEEGPMQLELQPVEVSLLRAILKEQLSGLKIQISNTENFELRQALKRDEEAIKRLIDRLEQLD